MLFLDDRSFSLKNVPVVQNSVTESFLLLRVG